MINSNNMPGRKLFIISDLHIGGDEITDDFECEEELIKFLDSIEENHSHLNKSELELIILGDLFDFWKVEKHEDDKIGYILSQRKKLFERFRQFGERFQIIVLGGNHDHELVYKKDFQEKLRKYNMIVDKNRYFKREFKHRKKVFKIIGEHGNQVEPSCKFPEFGMPTDSSLAYYIAKLFVHKIIRLKRDDKRPNWIKDLDNIDVHLIPYWLVSKYFYYEFGPVLRGLMIPMLILFSLAVPYFIFDIVTDFYHPRFMEPVLLLLDTHWFFKAIIFILYFDMVVVIILFFLSLLRKHMQMTLKEYGVQNITELLITQHRAFIKHAKLVIDGKNDFNEKADLYVTGHTHIAEIYKEKSGKTLFADSGSWKTLLMRATARFHFPPVYVPYYSLNYLVFEVKDGKMNVELREWPKYFVPELTLFEKLAIKKRKDIPKPIEKDRLVKKANLAFS